MNGRSSRAGVEEGRAYRRPSGRWRLWLLNNGGTWSDPGIERHGTGKLGTLAAGTE